MDPGDPSPLKHVRVFASIELASGRQSACMSVDDFFCSMFTLRPLVVVGLRRRQRGVFRRGNDRRRRAAGA